MTSPDADQSPPSNWDRATRSDLEQLIYRLLELVEEFYCLTGRFPSAAQLMALIAPTIPH